MEIIDLIRFVLQILLVPIAFVTGRFTDKRHLASLALREEEFKDITVNNLKRITSPESVKQASLVMGQVVIATDYYKSFTTMMRNIIGGEAKNALSLCVRARREALLRMLLEAREMGATEVWNVRYGFSNIAGQGSSAAMQLELVAYGTAVTRH